MSFRMLRSSALLLLVTLTGLYSLAPVLRKAPGWLRTVSAATGESGCWRWEERDWQTEGEDAAIQRSVDDHSVRKGKIREAMAAVFYRQPARRADRVLRADRSFFAWVQAQGNIMRRRIFKKPRTA